MLTVVAPLLVRVAVCAGLVVFTVWLPKFNELGETETAAVVPLPESETVCGLLESLSAMLSVADSAETVVGLNVTLIVQLEPAATLAPHVLVSKKSALLVPVNVMLLMFNVTLVRFPSVTVCAALVVLIV